MANSKRGDKETAVVPTQISPLELRTNAADLTNRVEYKDERFVVVRRGKPIAALVSIRDLKTLQGAA